MLSSNILCRETRIKKSIDTNKLVGVGVGARETGLVISEVHSVQAWGPGFGSPGATYPLTVAGCLCDLNWGGTETGDAQALLAS